MTTNLAVRYLCHIRRFYPVSSQENSRLQGNGRRSLGHCLHVFREYMLQVICACVIALPCHEPLAARICLSYEYPGAVVAVVAVVLFTVSGQIWKAANSNPADVVKSE